MAKFCSNCGKKLEEGKSCNCKQETNIMNNELVTSCIYIIKNIFVKPIDVVKEYTKANNFKLALILSAIMSILTALFMMPMVKEFANLIYGTGEISLYSAFVQTIEIPYFKIFLGVCLLVFSLTFVFTGALYLANTIIFKGESDFKTIYALYGVCSVVTSFALALGTLMAFLNIYLGLIVLMAGLILNMTYMIYGIKFIGPKDENKYGYIYLVAVVVNMIVTIFITKLFS